MIAVLNWLLSVMTFGLVSLASISNTMYYIDEPISELNGLSLNEVFNLQADLNDFDEYSTSTYGLARYTNAYQINNNYYVSYEQKIEALSYTASFGKNRINFINGTIFLIADTIALQTGEYVYFSKIFTANTTQSKYITFYNSSSSNSTQFVKNVVIVDMTDLGINQTKDEMDDWYDIYIKSINNEGVYYENTYILNTLDMSHVVVIVGSFFLWTWLYKFLKGVVL